MERFEREFAFIVGEERYVQQVNRGWIRGERRNRRDLISNVLFMWVPDGPLLIMARAVRTVDDKAVADSAQRLERLLTSDHADPSVKQRLLRDETARFNIGSTIRNFSDPTLVGAVPARTPSITVLVQSGGSGQRLWGANVEARICRAWTSGP